MAYGAMQPLFWNKASAPGPEQLPMSAKLWRELRLAAQFGAAYVDTATPYLGNEALFTFQDDQPAGSSVGGLFGGVLPIGNVHPNQLGYDAIARQVAAATPVPEPSTWAMMLGGLGLLGLHARKRLAARRGSALV